MLNYFGYDYPAPTGDVPFSVNVDTGRYYCHKCGSRGNQLA